MNAREVLEGMIRTERGDMTVHSPAEVQVRLDAYRAEVLAEAAAAPVLPVWLGTPVTCPHCDCEQTHCNTCHFDMYDPPIGGGA